MRGAFEKMGKAGRPECSAQERRSVMTAVVAGGCSATATQVIVLRECLSLFYGCELTAGVVLFFWLVWTGLGSLIGGRIWPLVFSHRRDPHRVLSALVALYGSIIPLSVLWVRASRALYGLGPGELVPLAQMVLVVGSVTGPVCVFFGLFFSTAWALCAETFRHSSAPYRIYALECLGAAAGGLWLYLFLSFRGSLLHGAAFLGAGLALLGWGRLEIFGTGKSRPRRLLIMVVAASAVGSTVFLEDISRRWQWGSEIVAVEDTPYRNLALLRREAQESLMADGLWLFSFPDPQSAEETIHLTLLQHPAPQKVLVLGPTSPENLQELERHPHVQKIHVVDADSTVARFENLRHTPRSKTLVEAPIGRLLPSPFSEQQAAFPKPLPDNLLTHPDRKTLFLKADARRFVETTDDTFDVVLLNAGDPLSLGDNRLFTKEFFQSVARVLRPGGIVSFSISGAEDMLGQAQAAYFRVMKDTFQVVFPQVILYPGERIRFVGALDSRYLSEDPGVLSDRIHMRRLRLRYVRPDRLENLLDPFRLAYFRSVDFQGAGDRPNADGDPVGFVAAFRYWMAHVHPRISSFLDRMLRAPVPLGMGVLITCGAAVVPCAAAVLLGTGIRRTLLAAAVGGMGAAQMGFHILILFVYQVVAGALYTHLSVLVSISMAGFSAGAFLARRFAEPESPEVQIVRKFFGVHAFAAAFLAVIFRFGSVPVLSLGKTWPISVFLPFFAAVGFLMGTAGGAHFALGCMVAEKSGTPKSAVGGMLYGVDLLGAAVAAAATPLLLVPAFGVQDVFSIYGILLAFLLVLNWGAFRWM